MTSLSHTSPNISEISFHHTIGICTQPLTCIPKYEELSKDMWPKWFAVFFRVRCCDAFLLLWIRPKVTTTSTMESIYTLILSVWNRHLEHCVFLVIYLGYKNLTRSWWKLKLRFLKLQSFAKYLGNLLGFTKNIDLK